MMLFPSVAGAQTTARSLDEFEGSNLVATATASLTQAAAQGKGDGRKLDMPHGPDMLLGAGIGAGMGALITQIRSGMDRPPTRRAAL